MELPLELSQKCCNPLKKGEKVDDVNIGKERRKDSNPSRQKH